MARSLKPALILLDIGLPGMDGLDVMARVEADPALQHIVFIALTASAMRGDRERFLEAGCHDYISKPVQAIELIAKVQAHLSANAPQGRTEVSSHSSSLS